jgi:hypothetical protein
VRSPFLLNGCDRLLPSEESIAIANQALLLTRNTKDFGQIQNLTIADWTI